METRTVLERLAPGARVAVIRLRSLGDCVLTTPALAILHQARPDLRIAIVVEPRFEPVFHGNPAVERTLPPGIGELRRWQPALVLNLHGGTRSLALSAASGARLRAGFAHFRFAAAYNIRVPRAQEILDVARTVHTAEHLACAMFYLGVPKGEIPRARLFTDAPERARRAYAVLHPAASTQAKTWPAANFLALASILESRLDLEPVFIGAWADDLSPFAHYRCVAGAPLEDVKRLLAGATLFAGNDSGPAHMAAAFGLPSLVFFGASDPAIWGPWKTEWAALNGGVEEAAGALDRLGASLPR